MPLREPCKIADCFQPVDRRGWCNRHYLRWYRHGDPLAGGLPRHPDLTDEERFWTRVDASGDCWIWTAATNANGYGLYGTQIASRAAWEYLIGPIPPGLTIDHLCYNPPCVNPNHLRLLTLSENAKDRRYTQRYNAEKTHCPQGHPYDEDNTYRPPRDPTHRMCRACGRARAKVLDAKRKAERRRRRAG